MVTRFCLPWIAWSRRSWGVNWHIGKGNFCPFVFPSWCRASLAAPFIPARRSSAASAESVPAAATSPTTSAPMAEEKPPRYEGAYVPKLSQEELDAVYEQAAMQPRFDHPPPGTPCSQSPLHSYNHPPPTTLL